MGYYTTYNLKVIQGEQSLIKEFCEENENARYAFDDNGDCQDECKWYDSDADMCAFSKKHPFALFMLEGEGEESGDIWRQYWRNGKFQYVRAELYFAPFEEEKLIDLYVKTN